MWDKKNEGSKPYRASSRAHEPSQTKLELGSFTIRAEPSWLVNNRANFEPSFLRAFFERVSSELRATSFLNTPRYDQQAALLAATYNRACAEAQIQAEPTPAPHTPAVRILQYDGRAPSRPASRSRREDRRSSYCEVHTINEDDSSYGSRTRGPIQSRLGPQGDNRQQSTVHRGSGIQSRLGPLPQHEGYGRTDPDDHTYCGDSHDTCSRPGGRNYSPPTHPRNTYLRAAKRPENQPYRPRAAAENSKFARRIAHAHVTTTKFPFNIGKYNGSSDPDDHMNIFMGAG
ncbi:hypothetical protein HanIR_Chr15g0773511 [Helianthus annuus]|nr:hypothetical protein HanIR_Chr15g0773511 [Helianthus annuus]